MKRHVEFYPWVHLLKSKDGYGVLYDLLSIRFYALNKQEFESLQKSLEEPVSEANDVVNKLLSLKFLFLCDEAIYMDRLRFGSQLDDMHIFPPGPQLVHAEIVLDKGCAYYDACPLVDKNATLSYSCELCYIGERCRSSDGISLNESHTEELIGIIRKFGTMNVSVNGSIFQEGKALPEVGRFVGLLLESKVQSIFFNISQFQIVQNHVLTKEILSNLISKYGIRIRLNISMFLEKKEQFLETLETIRRLYGVLLNNSTVTVAFDLSNLPEVESIMSNGTLSSFSNTCLAPYTKEEDLDLTNIDMMRRGGSLFKKWLHAPDIVGYTLVAKQNYIPCLGFNMLIDSDLKIANCKEYWIKGEASKIDRHSLRSIYSRWRWRKSENCYECPLRAGCLTCRAFMHSLFSKVDPCPLTARFLAED